MSRRTKVSGDEVVNAALQVVDEAGLDGLTIRAVAAVAGMSPMSLYVHFASKEQLLDHMARELSRRLYDAGEHSAWQASLRASCHCMRNLLLEHPNWLPLVSRPAPVADLPARERLLRQMVADGFTPEQAFKHVTHGGLVTLGMTMLELEYRDPDGGTLFARRIENLRAQSLEISSEVNSPATRAALRSSADLNFSASYHAILDAFISGIEKPAE